MRTLRTTRRDWTPSGHPAHIIWWIDDEWLRWTADQINGFWETDPKDQPRELGPYVATCAGPLPAYVEVRLCWHWGLECVQVDSYAETRRETGRWTGVRHAHFDTLTDAIAYAREEVRRLHRWLNSDGILTLPGSPSCGVSVPEKTSAELRRELDKLERRRIHRLSSSGHGGKHAIARRKAESQWDNERIAVIREQLSVSV